jgi:hypothetical protein
MAYMVSGEPPCSTPSAEPHQGARVRAQNPATPGDSRTEDKSESPFDFKNDIDCTSIPLVRAVVKWLSFRTSPTLREIEREDAAAQATLDPVDAGLQQEAREFPRQLWLSIPLDSNPVT